MTALNFPNNPTVGQIYTVADKSWIWTGKAWAIQRTGITGASAYDLAVQNGFVGTEAQWIASLKGATGASGTQGPAGTPGSAGPKGDPGTPGTNGTNGAAGTNGVGVPAGGGTGQVLQKNSNGDFDTHWVTPEYLTDYTVPLGGNSGQFLGKSSGSDGDFHWMNVPTATPANPELPTGGNTGQVLTKNSPTQGDVSWQNVPNASGVPDGGATGQVLTKNTNTDGDVSWQAAEVGVTEAPTDGNLYARSNTAWVAFTPGSGGSGSGGSASANNVFGTDTGPSGQQNGVNPHLYWRILNKIESGSENYISFSDLQFRQNAGSPTQNTGGTVLASGYYGNDVPQNAFDSNPQTSWISDNNLPNWIAYEFPTAVGISEVAMTTRYDGYQYQIPTSFDVQWSDDGTTWTTEWSVIGASWNGGYQQQTFTNTSNNLNVSQRYPTKLAALNDIAKTTPSNGQSLTWNTSTGLWTPSAGANSLAGLGDVDVTTNRPTDGQVLEYDSTSAKWIPGTASGGSSGGGIGSDLGDLQTAIAAKTARVAVTQNGELTTGNKIDNVVDKGGLVGLALFSNTSNGFGTRDTGSFYTVPNGCVAICFGGKADYSTRESQNYYATRLYNATQNKIVGSFINSGDSNRLMANGWSISYLGGIMSNSSGGGAATYDYPIAGVAGDQIRVENWTAGDSNYRMVNAEYYLIIVDASSGVQLAVTGNVSTNDLPDISGNANKALVVDSTGSHTQWSPVVSEAPDDGGVYVRQNDAWVAVSQNIISNSDSAVIVPQLVQSAYARGNGTTTATFSKAAKAGNTIFLIVSGYSSAKTVPSGFTFHSGGSYTGNQAVYTFFKVADGTEGLSFTVSGGDNFNVAAYEIQGQPTYSFVNGGSLYFTGQNWQLAPAPAPWGDSLTLCAIEHDLSVSFTLNNDPSIVDSFVFGNTDSNNHRGVTWVANQGKALAFSGAAASTSNPLFYTLQLGLGVKKSDSTSNTGTTNPVTQIPYRFGGWMTAPPAAGETLMMHVVTDNFQIPGNMSGSVGFCGAAPSAAFVLNLLKNGTQVGTINVSTAGVVTFTSNSILFAVGDVVTVVAPATDASVANVAWTFKGATV